MVSINTGSDIVKIELEVKENIGDDGGGNENSRDYEKLVNKPQINGITLEGDKALEEFGITQVEDCTLIQGIL